MQVPMPSLTAVLGAVQVGCVRQAPGGRGRNTPGRCVGTLRPRRIPPLPPGSRPSRRKAARRPKGC